MACRRKPTAPQVHHSPIGAGADPHHLGGGKLAKRARLPVGPRFEVLTGIVWDKQRECREHMDQARRAAQREILERSVPHGTGPAPRMLPGFGPAPTVRGAPQRRRAVGRTAARRR